MVNGYNFTEQVRKALARAREEAVRLHHDCVSTEHILLGVLRDDGGVAAGTLDAFGVDRDALRRHVEELTPPGRHSRVASPDLPYTSRAKRVLELAMREAHDFKHDHVGTEHLLLGLLGEEKGIAAQVLTDAGVNLDAARAETLHVLGGDAPARSERDRTAARSLLPASRGDQSADAAEQHERIASLEIAVHRADGTSFRRTFADPRAAIRFLEALQIVQES